MVALLAVKIAVAVVLSVILPSPLPKLLSFAYIFIAYPTWNDKLSVVEVFALTSI